MDRMDLLFRRLVEAAGRNASETGSDALTIGDLYQRLVPYRLVRGDLGFSELKEYEHALLRLLSGERGFVHVGQPEVADEFRRELAEPNPIVGIYRDYASVAVSLRDVTDPLPHAPPASPAPPPAREAARPPQPAPAHASPPRLPAEPAPRTSTPPVPPPGELCAGCRARLPRHAAVRFCPYCGAGQAPVACERCGETLQPGWSFCVQCGARRSPAATPSNG